LFIEQRGGGSKVSFRSRGDLDCSKLAERFGGGGHRPAAGAVLDLPLERAKELVLHATEEAMTHR
jgi:phosphoesterase RecJ-like protein